MLTHKGLFYLDRGLSLTIVQFVLPSRFRQGSNLHDPEPFWQQDRMGNVQNKSLDILSIGATRPCFGREKGRPRKARPDATGCQASSQASMALIRADSREILRATVLRCATPLVTPRIISG